MFCRSGLGALFKELGIIDDYIEINKSAGGWAHAEIELKKRKYNIIISAHQSFRTAKIVYSLCAQKKIGYKKWWNFFAYSELIERPMGWPEALRQLSLVASLDSELSNGLNLINEKELFLNSNTQADVVNTSKIPLWASVSLLKELKLLPLDIGKLSLPEKYIVVSPGSVWPTKRWPEDKFSEFINELELPVVLLGSPDEAAICARVESGTKIKISNICGQTSLLQTLQVMRGSQLVVSNDSGAQHMAATVGVPIVSIFGPTTLELGYRPWSEKLAIAEIDLGCRPCGKHGAKSCHLGTHECMKKLSSKKVLELAKSLIVKDL